MSAAPYHNYRAPILGVGFDYVIDYQNVPVFAYLYSDGFIRVFPVPETFNTGPAGFIEVAMFRARLLGLAPVAP